MINAHGGGILYHNGTYYWYGEYKNDSTYHAPGVEWDCYRTEAGGVACYSSKNLQSWKFEGIVLKPDMTDPTSDIHPSMVIERPKVIYNDKTKKFVMWMHIDNYNYSKAAAGVAISDSPTGNFQYLHSLRPGGEESRDMTLFKDENGKAYHIYSSKGKDVYKRQSINRIIRIDMPEQDIYAQIDRGSFIKILNNLFSNAIRYSDRNISIKLEDVGKHFHLTIKNDGEIVPSEMEDKIFDPFYQLKKNANINASSGIGLSLARSLSELHHGTCLLYTSRFV